MRFVLIVVPALLVTGIGSGGGHGFEVLTKKSLALHREFHKILTDIKDKKAAEVAEPRLKILKNQSAEFAKGFLEIAKAKGLSTLTLEKKYRPEMEAVEKQIEAELQRTHKVATVSTVLREILPTEKARKHWAQLDIRMLQIAVLNHNLKHGLYPKNLEVLTETDDFGNPPVLEKRWLTDPWNRPYGYDPAKENDRGVPHIWSEGQPPHRPEDRISNLQSDTDKK